jgi:hypothetical protein
LELAGMVDPGQGALGSARPWSAGRSLSPETEASTRRSSSSPRRAQAAGSSPSRRAPRSTIRSTPWCSEKRLEARRLAWGPKALRSANSWSSATAQSSARSGSARTAQPQGSTALPSSPPGRGRALGARCCVASASRPWPTGRAGGPGCRARQWARPWLVHLCRVLPTGDGGVLGVIDDLTANHSRPIIGSALRLSRTLRAISAVLHSGRRSRRGGSGR